MLSPLYINSHGQCRAVFPQDVSQATSAIFECGEFKYQDTYYRTDPFSGQEIVWKKGVPIWSMNYFGRTTKELALARTEMLSRFLKRALLMVSPNTPFRGPTRLDQGDWVYYCEARGDLTLFQGEEHIRFDGDQLFYLVFHGGVIGGW